MKKILNVEDATEIELKFEDGTRLNLAFNVKALSFVNDKCIGGLKGVLQPGSVAEYCAKVIYMTAKAAGEEITIHKARELTCQLKPKIITTIVEEYQNTYGSEMDEEAQKKTAEELIKALLK
jgi:hypothetical protein